VKDVVESRVAAGLSVSLVTGAFGRQQDQMDLRELAAATVLARQLDSFADDDRQPLATLIVAELEPN